MDTVAFPDGSQGELEIIRHPGAAAVLAVYRAGEWPGGTGTAVVLLWQYRYAAGGEIWEVPAGKLERGEAAEACARRELEEEAGVRAQEMRFLTTIHTTPGFIDERVHLFMARGLSHVEARPEASEFIESRTLPLERALEMVREGQITDSKTVCALLFANCFESSWLGREGGV